MKIKGLHFHDLTISDPMVQQLAAQQLVAQQQQQAQQQALYNAYLQQMVSHLKAIYSSLFA